MARELMMIDFIIDNQIWYYCRKHVTGLALTSR
jgi:hypothetical protein